MIYTELLHVDEDSEIGPLVDAVQGAEITHDKVTIAYVGLIAMAREQSGSVYTDTHCS